MGHPTSNCFTVYLQCTGVHQAPEADQCEFVRQTQDCQIDEGFVDYTEFVYCDFASSLLPLAVFVLVRSL